jgi:hypothetical protein
MELLHESHQAHIFTVNTDIPATPQILSTLLTGLAGIGLMPTFGNSLNARTGEKSQFVIMVSTDEKLRIEFALDRIAIIVEGKSIEEFRTLTGSIIQKLGELFPAKQSTRLSIVTNKIYSGNEVEYNELYKSLFTHKEVTPFEWDNRIAIKDNLESEELNVISTLRRNQVHADVINSGIPTDVIVSEIDVNTNPRVNTPRFPLRQANDMLIKILQKNMDFRSNLDRYFNI